MHTHIKREREREERGRERGHKTETKDKTGPESGVQVDALKQQVQSHHISSITLLLLLIQMFAIPAKSMGLRMMLSN